MSNKKRGKSTEEFKKEIYDLVGNEFEILGEYINNETDILIRHNCKLCNNHEFSIRPGNFKKRKKCPFCSKLNKQKKSNKKKTTEEFKQEVYKLVKDEYTVLGEYINCTSPILIRHNCELCNNYEYLVPPKEFINNNSRCPKCNGNITKTDSEFKKEIYDLVGDEYKVLGKYINNKSKIKFIHNCELCNNHEFEMRPNNFLSGQRCPKCKNINNGLNKRKTQEEFEHQIAKLGNNEYTVLSKYETDNTPVLLRHNCELCNNYEYYTTPNNFISTGSRCPRCSVLFQGTSNEEQEILNFIKSIESDIIENDRKILGKQELDIVCPSKKISIEYDGIYWHSESKGKDKNYHLNKTTLCNNKGYQLIHIFSDEWIYKKDLVKNKLKYIFGCSDNPKIYARKCNISEIKDNHIVTDFLNKNHIQGSSNSNGSIKLGLYYNNELVSVMTFCKPRRSLGQRDSKYDYELHKFASNSNYIVIGGFSKLFKYFEKNYDWKKIVTYADKRWSNGNLYIKNGWKYVHDSKPNYWYNDSFKRYHRYGFRKQVLKEKFPNIYSDNLTEIEIMKKAGYDRIWDCGNMVFEFDKNNYV